MGAAQVLASVIFLVMLVLIVLDKIERHIVALSGGALVMVLVFGVAMRSTEAAAEVLNLGSLFQTGFWYGEGGESLGGINWSTIIFIAGMMVMVEGMGRTGFFRWLCLSLAKMVGYRALPLVMVFMCMSGVLAMFIDSITVILFLVAVTVELARLLKFNPVPVIIAEIFCANLGGAATMCGDPPNIIIGTALGYTFFDFLFNTGLIVLICFVITLAYFFIFLRKDLQANTAAARNGTYPDPAGAITHKAGFFGSVVIFLIIVAMLITHSMTHISVATIGVVAAVLTLAYTLITGGNKAVAYVMHHVDYKTLLFFIGLFIVVGGLEVTGVLEAIAHFLGKVSGGNLTIMIGIIIWISALASAFVDNIPFAATMVPVIQSMAAANGVSLDVLAWTLAMGTDVGGNATPIGASANIVGTSVAAKEGYLISWGKFCKYTVPITTVVIALSMVLIMARYA